MIPHTKFLPIVSSSLKENDLAVLLFIGMAAILDNQPMSPEQMKAKCLIKLPMKYMTRVYTA